MSRDKLQLRFPLLLLPFTFSLLSLSCQTHKPMPNFAGLKQEYLDGLFLAKPHLATFMGDHRFDDRFADLSPPGIALRERVLEQQKLRLGGMNRNLFSQDD